MSSRETDEKEQLRLLHWLTAAAVHQEDGPSTVKLGIQALGCILCGCNRSCRRVARRDYQDPIVPFVRKYRCCYHLMLGMEYQQRSDGGRRQYLGKKRIVIFWHEEQVLESSAPGTLIIHEDGGRRLRPPCGKIMKWKRFLMVGKPS